MPELTPSSGYSCRQIKASQRAVIECRCTYCGFRYVTPGATTLERIKAAHRRTCRREVRSTPGVKNT